MCLGLLGGCTEFSKLFEEEYDPHFDIAVEYVGWTPSTAEEEGIAQAVSRWEAVLTSGVMEETIYIDQATLDANPSKPCGLIDETVDDLHVFVVLESSPEKPWASQHCLVREEAPWFPVAGGIALGPGALEAGEYFDVLADAVTHEIGHLLGIKAFMWEYDADGDGVGERDLVTGMTGVTCPEEGVLTYNGENTVAAWQALGGVGEVPLEDTGTPGTRCEHIDESTFGPEVMTGYVNHEEPNVLSSLSLGLLADLGYSVDFTAAEPYELP
ncbi:MAG: leishmanolysin-related zinc metalloendopeptidase [Myxococcota bacterium]|nr:leishmanolysin-related zinc metalloendopeptidase [Myxococcota bacterium]